MKNKKFAAKLSAIALFLTTIISGPALAATQTQYSEFGLNWSRVQNFGSTKAIGTSSSGSAVYKVDGNYVQFSNDYGKTWDWRTDGYENSGGTAAISVSGDGRVAAIVQNEGHIYITTDFGINWVKKSNVVSSVNFYDFTSQFQGAEGLGTWDCVSVSSSGQRIIVTEGPYVYLSENYGNTFSISEVSGSIKSVGMSGDGRIVLLASETGAKVFISNDYGSSFSRVGNLGSFDWTTVAVSGDGNYLLAGVWEAGIWISSNTGASWSQKKNLVTNKEWTRATISSYGERIVLQRTYGPPVTSGDFGVTFKERNTFTGANSTWTGLASSTDASRVYLAGANGVYTSVLTSYLAVVESNAGTVTFRNSCPANSSKVTSVQAQSVLLVLDTATVASDTSTYHYYTETNTALWGATYDYGSTQAVDCSYLSMTGSMTLSRGPFIASSGTAYSETSTIGANADFIQYIGNLNETGTAWTHTNNCGNTTVANLNVANVCNFSLAGATRQANWPALSQGTPIVIRTGVTSGISLSKTLTGLTTSLDPATVFVVVKAKKTLIAAAPASTSWVATETFTVTSA